MTVPSTPPAPSEADHLLIKKYLIYTLILDVLEQDIDSIRQVALHMPEVYILRLSKLQSEVTVSLTSLRSDMRTRGIRVYEESKQKEGIEALYLCRGYRRRLFLLWTFAKTEVKKEMSAYLGIDLSAGSER
ncbi:hypothetical protein QPK24_17065 [Paenibacillus polygoni]|uniref:Transcriptional regulator n=1 Tax=Paenibacillus polygoni TaxID=3050112 RepID=A0ABY8WY76_9BACL|nr:hypothetical protein [Paenibacillus polygoni]WIV18107.1 hypothetical protein QPK24_17065 [Paenibacillus polygoni]